MSLCPRLIVQRKFYFFMQEARASNLRRKNYRNFCEILTAFDKQKQQA